MHFLKGTTSVRILAAVLVTALFAAACGDDSGGGVSTEAFCAELENIDANGNLDIENPEALAKFKELTDQAPDQVRGAMEEFGRIADQLEGIEDDDPEAFGAVFALFGDRDFLQALKDISLFMADDCGLEVEGIDEIRDLDPDDPSALFGGLDAGSSDGTGDDIGLGLDGSGDDDATASDDFGDSTAADDEPSGAEQLGDFLDANYGDTSWASGINSRGIGSSGDNVTITVGFTEAGVPEADALAACEAVVEWASDQYDSASNVNIIVSDGDGDAALADDGQTCAAA